MSAPPEDGESASGSGDPPDASADYATDGAAHDVEHLRSRISQLETELERKDAELASVRRQYEAILQGRARDSR